MKIDTPLLQSIVATPGTSGFEQPIRKLIIDTIRPFVDTIEIDTLGNLIAIKKGAKGVDAAKKILVAAHMDEIGYIVKHIDDKGFVHLHTLGGFDPKTLVAQRVEVHGKEKVLGVIGTKPIHIMSEEDRKRPPKLSDFFVDLGLPVEKVKSLVSVGDPVTRVGDFIEMGDCLTSKSLDNRISVYVLIEVLRILKEHPYDLHAVFTVQEEIGLRGAQVVAHAIEPDWGLALDTTVAFDTPGSKPEEAITRLGEGSAIKIMDAGTMSDVRMVSYLKEVASRNELRWQPEILTAGSTDTAHLQRMGKGAAIAGAISIPTRYIHQTIETVHREDVVSAIKLLTHALEEMDTFDWSRES